MERIEMVATTNAGRRFEFHGYPVTIDEIKDNTQDPRCKPFVIGQPDFTVADSFETAADGSAVMLEFVDDGSYEAQYYVKWDGRWFQTEEACWLEFTMDDDLRDALDDDLTGVSDDDTKGNETSRLATMVKQCIDDPKTAVPALALVLSSADTSEEVVGKGREFLDRLSIGAAQCWKNLTGDELTPLRSYLMGLLIHADVWAELSKATGVSFDKEAFLSNSLRQTREQLPLNTSLSTKVLNDEMTDIWLKNEVKDAAKRIGAIREGGRL